MELHIRTKRDRERCVECQQPAGYVIEFSFNHTVGFCIAHLRMLRGLISENALVRAWENIGGQGR